MLNKLYEFAVNHTAHNLKPEHTHKTDTHTHTHEHGWMLVPNKVEIGKAFAVQNTGMID